MFQPSRLELARKRRGLTKKDLATAIGKSDKILTKYQKQTAKPTEETLQSLAKALDFPVSFFVKTEIKEISPDQVSFRALSNLPSYKRDAALASGDMAILLNNWIEQKFKLPEALIPDFRGYSPEEAAEALRAEWGLGHSPIKNIIDVLEANGVKVFSLPDIASEVDAFCFWNNNVPFVLLNTSKSAERGRFDASHELGHLVLHKHGDVTGRAAEVEADRFASAFLMPRSSVLAAVPSFITLESMIKMKKIWNVSLAALNHRLHSLGVTSEWMYRKFCIEISEKGYRKNEPNGELQESSQVFAKILQALRADNVMPAKISEELGFVPSELSALMFKLPVIGIQGQGISSGEKSNPPHLRLV